MSDKNEFKDLINRLFEKPNSILKKHVGDFIYEYIRDRAADILDETVKRCKENPELQLPILAYALGGAFFILRTSKKEQQDWLDLVSYAYESYEKFHKEMSNHSHDDNGGPVFMPGDGLKKKATNN